MWDRVCFWNRSEPETQKDTTKKTRVLSVAQAWGGASTAGEENEARTLFWWEPKPPSHWKKRQQSNGRKKFLASKGEAEVHFGRGTENTPVIKTKVHCFRKRGSGKTACSMEGAGNPLSPGSYTITKRSPVNPAGRNKTNLRSRLALAVLGRRNRNTGEPTPWGAGLPNTEDGPWRYRTPITPTTCRAQVTSIHNCYRGSVKSVQKAEWIRDTEENPPVLKTPF